MKNQSLFDEVETAIENFSIASARGDHAQNWHALRVSPSGEIYTVTEPSPCCSESEYYGKIPHTLTIHSEHGNHYSPTADDNPGWFVRDDGTLDLDCWAGDRPNADEVCYNWREKLQEWIASGNYTAGISTINYTNAGQMPHESGFDYVVEVAPWADSGITEYIGIIGQPSHDALRDMLSVEVDRIRKWVDDEAANGSMDARTDEPQIAIVRQRPEADEDGDFPPSHEWPIIIEWN